MKITGGCYCGEVRYAIDGDSVAAIQCHCRECQYFTGGQVNTVMFFSKKDFIYTQGIPKKFARSDIDNPVIRQYCGNCGTSIGNESRSRPDTMIIKVGTLDDPSIFMPETAIFTCDMQDFHSIPQGIPSYDKRPPRKDKS